MSGKHYPMRSDVRDKKDAYLLEVDLPGCKKEDVKLSLEKGYLEIEASINKEKEVKEDKGRKFLRKECFAGNYKRTFYIGDMIHSEQIKAAYKHGVLRIQIPKFSEQEQKAKKLVTIN